jgi:hypothetical protein
LNMQDMLLVGLCAAMGFGIIWTIMSNKKEG